MAQWEKKWMASPIIADAEITTQGAVCAGLKVNENSKFNMEPAARTVSQAVVAAPRRLEKKGDVT